jgi:hypothetical protein
MKIENHTIRGYSVKVGKEEKDLCPTCFAEYGNPANRDEVITADDMDSSETMFCDDCGNEL